MPLDRSLITRTSLHDVGKLLRFSAARNWDRFRQYSDMCDPVSLVFLDNINAVWDRKRKIRLPAFESIVVAKDSLLHRWVVLDTIESASSVHQESHGATAIAAARAWLIDPSERNRVAAEDAAGDAATAFSWSAAAAGWAVARAGSGWATNAAAWAVYTLGNSPQILTTSAAARLRIQVLAAIQDYLPEPV